jgi:uncharacterized protein (TIGR03663 family)
MAEAAAWAVLIALALTMRFWDLGAKPLHHDESLFTYYAWRIYWDREHLYQPILHGPMPLYGVALAFGFAGDSVASSRFWASLIGGLLPLGALAFRKRWGGVACLAAGGVLALSAPLMYYSRYCREDIPLLALTMLQIAAARMWWRKPYSNAAGCLFGLATLLPLGVKENHLITDFIFFVFLHLWIAADALRWRKAGRRPSRNSLLVDSFLALNVAGFGSVAVLVLIKMFLPGAISNPSAGLLAIMVATAADFWLLAMLWLRRKSPVLERIVWGLKTSWPGIVSGLGIATFVLQMLFTHFLHHPEAPHDLFKRTFDYWLGQHAEHRLKGPFHYYVSILAVYHLPELLLCFGAMAWRCLNLRKRFAYVGVLSLLLAVALAWADQLRLARWLFGTDAAFLSWMDKRLHMTSLVHVWLAFVWGAGASIYALLLLLEKRPIHAFCAFWTCWSFLFYGYAGEKIPWVAVNIALPLALWVGAEVKALLDWAARRQRRGQRLGRAWRWLILAGLGLALAWMGFNAGRACFADFGTNPAERIIYNHTAPHFQGAVDAALALAEARKAEESSVLIHYAGDPVWPLVFYFRRLGANARELPDTQWPEADLLFLDSSWLASNDLQKTHVFVDVPFRRFWQPELFWVQTKSVAIPFEGEFGPETDWQPVTAWLPWGEALSRAWRYYAFREPYFDALSPHGVWGAGKTAHAIPLGIRRDLLEGEGAVSQPMREFKEKLEGGYWD